MRAWATTRAVPRAGLVVCLCILSVGLAIPPAASSPAITSVGTMADLAGMEGTEGQMVHLLGYHVAGDKGGGLFGWDEASVAPHDGGMVVAVTGVVTGRWVRMADDVRVTYFGARGDGVADDTAAIQAAIDSVSSTASPGVVFEADRAVGGTVHFPAGRYRITDTLLVGPSTTLSGVGSPLGFQRRGLIERDAGAVIVAQFADPNRWMISSAVYYRDGEHEGELVPYRAIVGGRAYDRGLISRANAIRIENLLLIGEPNDDGEPPYGGIRLQACAGSVMQGVGVHGVDVAYMLNAGWGLAMRDCTSGSYLYGLLALHDVNGLHIDNCYFNATRSERVIDDGNVAPGHLGDRGPPANLAAEYPYMKTGILSHYGHNITLNNVITEHWDIARFHIHGQISDTGSWIEGNRELGYALVTVDLDLRNPRIYNPSMLQEGRFFRAGTNVRATISSSRAFPISVGVHGGHTANRITVLAADPDRDGWKHYPLGVTYTNQRRGHIRVAGDGDEAVDSTRLADTTAYVDLATALERVQASDQRDWTVTLEDGAVCDLARVFNLTDRRITFRQEGAGDRPVIRFVPGEDGRATLMQFGGNGACALEGVDLAVHNPGDALDTHRRGLMGLNGGAFRLTLLRSHVSLVDEAHAPDREFALLQSLQTPVIIDATFSDVRILNGHAVFVEGAQEGSVVSCRAVNTTAPPGLLARGENGWVGEGTVVLHSNIAPVRD